MIFDKYLFDWFPILNSSFFQYKEIQPEHLEKFNKVIGEGGFESIFTLMNAHLVWTTIIGLILLLIIGEFFFIRHLKKKKISYLLKDKVDEEVRSIKAISFIKALFIVVLSPTLFYFGVVMLLILLLVALCIVLNIGYVISVFGSAAIFVGASYLILRILFEGVYKVNKIIASGIVKVETEEEYNERQSKFKFRDGEEVKLKSDLVIDNRYGTKRYIGYKAKNKDKVLIVDRHLSDITEMRLIVKDTKEKCEGVYTDDMLERVNEIKPEGNKDGTS